MTTSTTTAGTTMRAIIQENYGEAENVLRLGQVGRPAIGDREVLLRVHAAGVDRGVWHLVAGLPHAVRLAGPSRPSGTCETVTLGARSSLTFQTQKPSLRHREKQNSSAPSATRPTWLIRGARLREGTRPSARTDQPEGQWQG
jgi:hypothetical protein